MSTSGAVPSILPAFERNNVPVVVASNDLWAPYTGVFIRSLLDHAGEGNHYDIIILNRDISEENKRLLKSLAAGHTNVSIRFFDPSPLFASFHYVDEEHRWPLEVFYRIVAPHFLKYPGRIITVDVDTLLKTDIARLMDEDLEGCCVGGVSNAPGIYAMCSSNRVISSSKNIRAQDYWRKILGLEDWKDWKSYQDYIQSGLLLFDCDRYVQEVTVKTILDAARRDDYFFPEQDVLNVLMRGKIKHLDLAWSVIPPLKMVQVQTEKGNAASAIYEELYHESGALKRAHEDPYLVHWAARPKPWVCPDVPYGSEWWQTALRTPFVGHIIARMVDELEKRRQYYRKRYGKEDVDVWDPVPKGIDRS